MGKHRLAGIVFVLAVLASLLFVMMAVAGCGGDSHLQGTWLDPQNGTEIEFSGNKVWDPSSDFQTTYKVDNGYLVLSASLFGMNPRMSYTVNGDTLTVEGEVFQRQTGQATTSVASSSESSTITSETTTTEPTTSTTEPATTTSAEGTTTTAASTSTTIPAASGTVLYQADWSAGANGWALSADWKTVNGMLVNDGSNSSIAVSPYDPGAMADYAVEADIQDVSHNYSGFGVAARVVNGAGYYGGIFPGNFLVIGYVGSSDSISSSSFDAGTKWHHYRIEVRGNQLHLLLDGALVLQATDNRFLSPGTVGLICISGQISVKNFRVVAL